MTCAFESLFLDESIEDIVLNPNRILYFKKGHWTKWTGHVPERLNVFSLARNIADSVDIELGYTHPSADAYWRLSDQHHFRAHVICPPMIENGPEITLRRIRHTKQFSLESFQCSTNEAQKLKKAVREAKNILVCGATGAGKSSFLYSLMAFIPDQERVIILEDSPELPLVNGYCSRLLARNDRFHSRQGSTWQMTDLVVESLRMRPTRLILGECRGSEALALCRALQTGHSGVMTTVHAGNTEEAMARIADLCRDQSLTHFEQKSLWDLVIFIKTNTKGERFVASVYEKHSP